MQEMAKANAAEDFVSDHVQNQLIRNIAAHLEANHVPKIHDHSEVTSLLARFASDAQEKTAHAKDYIEEISQCTVLGVRLLDFAALLLAHSIRLQEENPTVPAQHS